MPELPEVETIRFDLDKTLKGYFFTNITVSTPKMLTPDIKTVFSLIKNKKIESIKRKAKLLIFELSNDQVILIHLKMSGRLLIRNKNDTEDRWTRIIFSLKKENDEKELRFADQRKFGYVKVIKRKLLSSILMKYGPEPFVDLNFDKFYKIIKKSKKNIKNILMDQSIISGIGNIYANDALYLSNINPERNANELNDIEINNLYQAIESVLKAGLTYRGASDNSYLDAFGKKGKYQEHFLIYGKNGEECVKCHDTIKRIKLGGRGTFFCPSCQKRS